MKNVENLKEERRKVTEYEKKKGKRLENMERGIEKGGEYEKKKGEG